MYIPYFIIVFATLAASSFLGQFSTLIIGFMIPGYITMFGIAAFDKFKGTKKFFPFLHNMVLISLVCYIPAIIHKTSGVFFTFALFFSFIFIVTAMLLPMENTSLHMTQSMMLEYLKVFRVTAFTYFKGMKNLFLIIRVAILISFILSIPNMIYTIITPTNHYRIVNLITSVDLTIAIFFALFIIKIYARYQTNLLEKNTFSIGISNTSLLNDLCKQHDPKEPLSWISITTTTSPVIELIACVDSHDIKNYAQSTTLKNICLHDPTASKPLFLSEDLKLRKKNDDTIIERLSFIDYFF